MKHNFVKRTCLAACLLFLVWAVPCSAKMKFHKNPVIAHRGAWLHTGHPQNSLASFRAAATMGCHGSECDVWFTKEDSLVIFHDAKRNGKYIEESTFAELRQQPLANGERIPTMREYLAEAMKQKKTKLIIDVKTLVVNKPRTTELFHAVHRLVCEMGAEPWVEYLGGYLPAILEMQKETKLHIAYLGLWNKDLPECAPESVEKCGLRCLDYQDLQYAKHPEWLPIFRKKKLHLNVWTVDREQDMRYFLGEKFHYVTTNEPELLLKVSKKK